MIKLVIGLLGIMAVAGTADTNASAPIVALGAGLLISSAFFIKGVHELIGLNTIHYDR